MTDRVFFGILSGAPRLLVARPGYDALSSIGDSSRLAFDSDWLEMSKLLAAGVAYAGGGVDGDGYYWLAGFPTQAFAPIAWVYAKSAVLGVPYTMGGDTPQTTFPIKVTTSSLLVRTGNLYNGYTRPGDALSYVVFKNSIS